MKFGGIIGNKILFFYFHNTNYWYLYSNETVASCTDPTVRTLAEPPVLRERLTTEIEFFVKHIHEQCANNDQIFRRRLSNGHNWNAINYALVTGTGDDERRIRERPVSARDRQGRETPILIIPEPAANIDDTKITNLLSPRTVSNIDIDTIRNKLEDFTIDDIIQRLRQAVTDDIKILEDHVTYLHVRLILFRFFCFEIFFYFSKNWKRKQIIGRKQEVFYVNQHSEVTTHLKNAISLD